MKTTETRTKNRWKQAIAVLAFLVLTPGIYAQVTVGSNKEPESFSVLEIISNQKTGLRMAHLTTAERNKMTTAFIGSPEEELAKGLTIYNTTIDCMEFWNGKKWISTCEGNPLSIPNTEGEGTFTGKVCFDLAQGNNATEYCAPLTSRTAKKTTFTNTTEQDPAQQIADGATTSLYTGVPDATFGYSGVQVYTFTPPTGGVSNVRFGYIDISGKVVASIEPKADYSGNDIDSPCKAVVTYNPSLSTDLKNLTTTEALKADLYVIYNDAADGMGADKYLKLAITLSDCACCGAMATPLSGNEEQLQWQTFMCYNLGADQTLDPFTWKSDGDDVDNDIKGYLYQWGRQSDGHEKRKSAISTMLATNNQATFPFDVIGKFILPTFSPGDWLEGSNEISRWGDGSRKDLLPKGVNDPCPTGWKVPTRVQWKSLNQMDPINGDPYYKWKWTGSGYLIGDDLYIPCAGYRDGNGNTGSDYFSMVGTGCNYWTASPGKTTYDISSGVILLLYADHLSQFVITMEMDFSRGMGLSVRCVLE
ncbi:hypothetical protein D0T84_12345 [Dysgonomonas sp. 521]|uniref:FISUMP domain-containing protein n=1 Tax=Dysgonomonas sp. 521 TaxID=2302932 RepID=UPI0013D881C5|nr:FISUMP domain-containing protein [Dysgonomonas sp. 521]NDV95698.1 hypothetical protein [Dysgonomonas sp. 521]